MKSQTTNSTWKSEKREAPPMAGLPFSYRPHHMTCQVLLLHVVIVALRLWPGRLPEYIRTEIHYRLRNTFTPGRGATYLLGPRSDLGGDRFIQVLHLTATRPGLIGCLSLRDLVRQTRLVKRRRCPLVSRRRRRRTGGDECGATHEAQNGYCQGQCKGGRKQSPHEFLDLQTHPLSEERMG